MDKRYDHTKYEEKIYSLWEKSAAFTPLTTKHRTPYTIIMPPPNANDNLHIGHARFVTIEDILIRYKRMQGFSALWLPGADHAGIETQYVFEKKLREKGKSRFDYDQTTLYKMIWDYVQKNKSNMENQLRALGSSCDWTRNFFTLDPRIIKVVYATFKKLYDDGLVYRGERIVNYCPHCGTSFSQLEVNYIERDDPFYYLDYGPITIATTRPETIFADVAVAVNPKDKKYQKLIGKLAKLPIVNRDLPIIADSLVDIELGTGALKITPGHDATDFEIGEKHSLARISVIDEKGKMINTPQRYIGLSAQKAREEVVSDLKKLGKVKKIETIHHTVGVCYKHKSPIEPMLSEQWFIKVETLAKKALSAIQKGEVKFAAKSYEKIGKHWLRNLRDWNISRQIVWGIRIPAWRCEKCMKWTITNGNPPKKCSSCKYELLTQDADTFDTWFSSGQWPFATLLCGKGSRFKVQGSKFSDANPNSDFNYFYPTSVMETAYDILPFWVLRMIMLGLYATGEVPFREVVIHGLVRDAKGDKISKSKGNVIDPLVMSQKYGADALRMGITWGALVENDIALSEDNIRAQRNFSNKLWNIARFILQSRIHNHPLPATCYQSGRRPRAKTEDDKWILAELKKTIKKVTQALDKYRLNEAAEEIYDFVWHQFADIYLEKSKNRIRNYEVGSKGNKSNSKSTPNTKHQTPNTKQNKDAETVINVLYYVLETCLKLLHPFMPFVTEAIYQQAFSTGKDDFLISSSWPKK